jgi:hypothetical protein
LKLSATPSDGKTPGFDGVEVAVAVSVGRTDVGVGLLGTAVGVALAPGGAVDCGVAVAARPTVPPPKSSSTAAEALAIHTPTKPPPPA